jgi:hypothetical protein
MSQIIIEPAVPARNANAQNPAPADGVALLRNVLSGSEVPAAAPTATASTAAAQQLQAPSVVTTKSGITFELNQPKAPASQQPNTSQTQQSAPTIASTPTVQPAAATKPANNGSSRVEASVAEQQSAQAAVNAEQARQAEEDRRRKSAAREAAALKAEKPWLRPDMKETLQASLELQIAAATKRLDSLKGPERQLLDLQTRADKLNLQLIKEAGPNSVAIPRVEEVLRNKYIADQMAEGQQNVIELQDVLATWQATGTKTEIARVQGEVDQAQARVDGLKMLQERRPADKESAVSAARDATALAEADQQRAQKALDEALTKPTMVKDLPRRVAQVQANKEVQESCQKYCGAHQTDHGEGPAPARRPGPGEQGGPGELPEIL